MNSLKITSDQVESFQRDAVSSFEEHAVAHIRKHFAEESAHETDEQVVRRIRTCRTRAATYDLTTQKQIVSFVDVTYMLGLDFDHGMRHPDLYHILRDRHLEPTEKAGLIVGCAMALRKPAGETPR